MNFFQSFLGKNPYEKIREFLSFVNKLQVLKFFQFRFDLLEEDFFNSLKSFDKKIFLNEEIFIESEFRNELEFFPEKSQTEEIVNSNSSFQIH